MQLGFVSAILPDQTVEQVFEFAADVGYDCVELMCWPVSKAERRYAGVTHVDVTEFTPSDAQRLRKAALPCLAEPRHAMPRLAEP